MNVVMYKNEQSTMSVWPYCCDHRLKVVRVAVILGYIVPGVEIRIDNWADDFLSIPKFGQPQPRVGQPFL